MTFSEPIESAGRRVLTAQFEKMTAQEPGALAGEDPEAIHKMRVALRRSRSALKLFGPHYPSDDVKWITKGLRRTMKRLGAVRDLDVIMDLVRPLEAPTVMAGLREKRTAALARLRETLQGERYAAFKADYNAFLVKGPRQPRALVRHYLASGVYTRYEAMRTHETAIEDGDAEALHDLRIAGKELRYTLEFFDEGLGAAALIAALKGFQDHLGTLNDAHTGIALLLDLIGQGAPTEPLQAQAEKLRADLPARWQTIAGEAFRQGLAQAVGRI